MSVPWFGPYVNDDNKQQDIEEELRETQQREQKLLGICSCFLDELKDRLDDIHAVQDADPGEAAVLAALCKKVSTRRSAMLKQFEELAVVEEVSSLRAKLQGNDKLWMETLQALSSTVQKDHTELEHSDGVVDHDVLDESGGQSSSVDPAAGDAYGGGQDSSSRSDASDMPEPQIGHRRPRRDSLKDSGSSTAADHDLGDADPADTMDDGNTDSNEAGDAGAVDEADEKEQNLARFKAIWNAKVESKRAEDQDAAQQTRYASSHAQPSRIRAYNRPWQQESAYSHHDKERQDREAIEQWDKELQRLPEVEQRQVERVRKFLCLDPTTDWQACTWFNSDKCERPNCGWSHKYRCNSKYESYGHLPSLVDRWLADRDNLLQPEKLATFDNRGARRHRHSIHKQMFHCLF